MSQRRIVESSRKLFPQPQVETPRAATTALDQKGIWQFDNNLQ
jgi:hypothetical protein